MVEKIILKVDKEKATLEDSCDLCDRPMKPNMTFWIHEAPFGMIGFCDDCKKQHEVKEGFSDDNTKTR